LTKIRNGFTLMEVIITLAIMSILGIAISQMFNSTYRTNTSINDSAEYQADAQIIMEKIQNELKYANYVAIDLNAPTGIASGTKYLYVSGGIPEKNQGASLSDAVPIVSLKTGFTSVLTFKQSISKSVEIIVDIFKNGTKVYTLDTNVNLNNMISNSVSGLAQGSSIKYTLPSSALVQSIIITSSSSTINTDKGTQQMIANILPLNATNGTINWSKTDGTGTATIDQNTGMLSALTNGTVTVNAKTVDGSVTSPGLVITISGQNAASKTILITVGNNVGHGNSIDVPVTITIINTNNPVNFTLVGIQSNGNRVSLTPSDYLTYKNGTYVYDFTYGSNNNPYTNGFELKANYSGYSDSNTAIIPHY